MPDQPTFVVNDRRKFTSEGDLRPDHVNDAPATPAQNTPAEATDSPRGPQLVAESAPPTHSGAAELADLPEAGAISDLYPDQSSPENEDAYLDGVETGEGNDIGEDSLPQGPTPEQAAEAARAYEATIDRLDTAMRAANPGGERIPPMSFERLVQSLYTQALILLGGGAQPGEQPRVDILGAKDTIDMLQVLANKSKGNLSDSEDKLLQSALFDLQMGFLEITQALARQAAQRQGASPAGGFGGPGGASGGGFGSGFGGPQGAPGGPRIVR